MSEKLAPFEVDLAGLRQLQAGMEPWAVVKEVVVNVFDLEDATVAKVELSHKDGKALFVVEDDGIAGFRRLRDSWTLYGFTEKRSNPEMRGRYNLGDKYALSLASYGKVSTTTGTVEWKNGKRYLYKDQRRDRGTVVILELDWTEEQTREVETKLRTLIPPYGQNYYLNGEQIPHRQPIETIEATLSTVLLKNGRMSPTSRKTKILVYVPQEGEQPQLMEMGVPVCEVEMPWSVSVEQKIPLSPNRDSVRPSYLRDVAAEVLNKMVIHLTEEQAAENWVDQALKDDRCTDETVKAVMQVRYPKTVIWSPDSLANEKARDRGLQVVHPRGLDKAVVSRFREVGMQTTHEKFGVETGKDDAKPLSIPIPNDEWTAEMQAFEGFAKRLGKILLHYEPEVVYANLRRVRNANFMADFGNRTLRVYVNRVGKDFFKSIPEVGFDARQIGILIHEFAHHVHKEGDEPHGARWKDELEILAGQTVRLALESPRLFDYERYRK